MSVIQTQCITTDVGLTSWQPRNSLQCVTITKINLFIPVRLTPLLVTDRWQHTIFLAEKDNKQTGRQNVLKRHSSLTLKHKECLKT